MNRTTKPRKLTDAWVAVCDADGKQKTFEAGTILRLPRYREDGTWSFIIDGDRWRSSVKPATDRPLNKTRDRGHSGPQMPEQEKVARGIAPVRSMRIPNDVWDALEKWAEQQRTSVTSVLVSALRKALNVPEKK